MAEPHESPNFSTTAHFTSRIPTMSAETSDTVDAAFEKNVESVLYVIRADFDFDRQQAMVDYLFEPIVNTISTNRHGNCHEARFLFRAVTARIANEKEFAVVGSRICALILTLVRTSFTDHSMALTDGTFLGSYAYTRELFLSELQPAFEQNQLLLEFVFEMWTCGYVALHVLSEVVTSALETDPPLELFAMVVRSLDKHEQILRMNLAGLCIVDKWRMRINQIRVKYLAFLNTGINPKNGPE